MHGAGLSTRADIQALRAEIAALERRVESANEANHDLVSRWDVSLGGALEADRRVAELTARLHVVEQLQRIDSVSRWIKYASLPTSPLVSVVVPTKDRVRLLARALDSLLRQRYARFEVLIVDDGGEEDSEALVESLGDARLRWTRIAGGGVCAARNAGLALAKGEILAYLDDDNLMDPGWLYSVVWAFGQRPEIDVLYGAIVVDDVLRIDGRSSGELPHTFLHAWNRDALQEQDMSIIAHRTGLREARFDESLSYHGDGDFLRRITTDRDPLVLPVVACYYTTDAPGRISDSGWTDADRKRSAELRPDHPRR